MCVRPAFTSSENSPALRPNEAASSSSAGSSRSRASATAARCTADGNTSFEDWPMFTWSFGCTSSPARLAITSLAFMFDEVPEPVWNTSIGNWSSCSPLATSSPAAATRSAISASSSPSSPFTRAAAALMRPSQRTTGAGTRSPETGKLSTALRVSEPHSSCCTAMPPSLSRASSRPFAAAVGPGARVDGLDFLVEPPQKLVVHPLSVVAAAVRRRHQVAQLERVASIGLAPGSRGQPRGGPHEARAHELQLVTVGLLAQAVRQPSLADPDPPRRRAQRHQQLLVALGAGLGHRGAVIATARQGGGERERDDHYRVGPGSKPVHFPVSAGANDGSMFPWLAGLHSTDHDRSQPNRPVLHRGRRHAATADSLLLALRTALRRAA